LDDPLFFEGAQTQRQRPRADPLERALELAEPRPSFSQVPDHQQRPLPAYDLGGAAHRTVLVRCHPNPDSSAMLHELKPWRLEAIRAASSDRGTAQKAGARQ